MTRRSRDIGRRLTWVGLSALAAGATALGSPGPAPVTNVPVPVTSPPQGAEQGDAFGDLLQRRPSTPLVITEPSPPRPFHNPIVRADAPDPGVTRVGDRYVMATTGGGTYGTFPLRTSTDGVQWTETGALFRPGEGPSWAKGNYWAPEIHPVGDRYVAYFSALHRDGRMAIGAAVADQPEGPFTDIGHPIVPGAPGGSIDSHFFRSSSGEQFLYWKDNQGADSPHARIIGRKLTADGLAFAGEPVELLRNDLPWEGSCVEAPWMLERDGRFYLLYSGNVFFDPGYAGGWSVGASPLGPFEKAKEPFLVSGDGFVAPGHFSVVEGPDGGALLYAHGIPGERAEGARLGLVAHFDIVNGVPQVNGGRGLLAEGEIAQPDIERRLG